MAWRKLFTRFYRKREVKKKTNKKHVNIFTTISNKIFHNADDKLIQELNWREFICIIFALNLPLNYWVTHITIIKKWGAFLVIISNTISSILFSVPLFMIYNFMGQYSRKSYIKYWNCVPVLKGVAVSIAIYSIIVHIFDVSVSGLALLYLVKVFRTDLPWVECEFEGADENCMETLQEVISEEGVTGNYHAHRCCNDFWPNCSQENLAENLAKYATMDYYMGNVLKLSYNYEPLVDSLITSWVICVAIVWVLVFIFMLVGLSRFKKIVCTTNQIIIFVLIFISFLILCFSSNYSSIVPVRSDFNNLLSFKFWVETIFASLCKEIPGEIIAFSAVSKSQISTTADAIGIYCLKLGFVGVLTAWLSMCVNFIQDNYNIHDIWCIRIEGDLFIFTLIPDTLQRWLLGQVWLVLYYILIIYWGFASCVYVCNAFVEAIFEEFANFRKWRQVFCVMFCLAVGGCNVLMLKPNFMVIFREQLHTTLLPTKTALVFFSLVGVLLYTVRRLKTDYYFTHGELLSPYCSQGAKITIFILGTLSVTAFLESVAPSTHKPILLVLLLPIPAGAIIVGYQFVARIRPTLVNPDPSWGSPDISIRNARRRYDPTYDLRHDISSCTHRCLLKSEEIDGEAHYWRQKIVTSGRKQHDE